MYSELSKYRTLVLNADYMPISLLPGLTTIPVDDALVRVFNETCYVVAEYNRKIKTPNPKNAIKLPAVIVRKEYMERCDNVALTRTYLYLRDNGTCAYTGQELTLEYNKPNSITIDHVYPRYLGGKHEWNNVVCAAPRINHLKGHNPPIGEWKPKIRPYTPTYHELVEKRRYFPLVVDDASWIDFLPEWKAEIRVRNG